MRGVPALQAWFPGRSHVAARGYRPRLIHLALGNVGKRAET